ncbi:hypothetical protein CMO94_01605 [Candidatus Woesearchaeota archaeon]|jgi:hypothetical protein|nr:hypothetical protein [Candidatus Woesearchaeota archaeon]|tara:strand:- start:3359 stop:3751 length:393 start_codon:yes stop_codon:yes gene_type:complete
MAGAVDPLLGLLIEISDQGTGIPGDILPGIFGTYTGREKQEGDGVRGQIISRVSELGGGDIVLQSTTVPESASEPTTSIYDTLTDSTHRVERPDTPVGTILRLYFPQTADLISPQSIESRVPVSSNMNSH